MTQRVPTEQIYFRRHARADERFQSPLDTKFAAIDRDRAVCGLTAKAASTHKSIGLLAAAGQIGDAVALCRVLMENVFTLSWILQDSGLRLDVFVLADEIIRRRLAEVVLEHYTHQPEMCADAQRLLNDGRSQRLAAALEGSWERLARREDAAGRLVAIGPRGMFRDLGINGPDGEKRSFMYDAAYFDQSHHVHSTIASLRLLDLESSEIFRLDITARQSKAAEIMNAANLFYDSGTFGFREFHRCRMF